MFGRVIPSRLKIFVYFFHRRNLKIIPLIQSIDERVTFLLEYRYASTPYCPTNTGVGLKRSPLLNINVLTVLILFWGFKVVYF